MSDDDGALTAQERGDSHVAARWVVRVVMVVAVVALVVGVTLTGNYVHTGTFLPWLASAGQSDSAVVGDSPTATASATPGAQNPDAEPRTPAERVAAEDARLTAVAALSSDDPALLDTWNTVVLAPKNGQHTVYSGADLLALGALRADDAMTSTLVRNVVIRSGAELDLAASYEGKSGTYRLSSSPQLTTSIVAWGGSLAVIGAKDAPGILTSWDDTTGGPDLDESDGRAYIRARDGVLMLFGVSVEHLGYWSGRTGGLSATGSGSGSVAASLRDVKTVGLHYGFFGSDTTAVGIQDSRLEGSAMTGVELTNGAADTTIQGTTVTGSGADGITFSRQSKNVKITDSTVEKSGGWGVRADGAALADGPTTGGYALTPSSGFVLTGSHVRGNREGGVRVISTDATEIRTTTVDEARTAVLIEGPSSGLTVENADLTSSELRALDITGKVDDATVSDSRLAGRRIALEVTGAAVTVRDNDLTVASGAAVELADGARADVTGNVFRGVGQDTVASWSGSRSMQADNDQSDWVFQWAWVGWMNEHPMMWMWALVLLVPAIGLPLLWRRRREHAALRKLLHEALLRHGEQQVATYARGAVPALAVASGPGAIAAPFVAPSVVASSAAGVDASADMTTSPETRAPVSNAPVSNAPVSNAPVSNATAGVDVSASTTDAPSPRGGGGPGSWSATRGRAEGSSKGATSPATTGPAAIGRPAAGTGAAFGSRPATGRPRSFADLKTGPLEGRTFASLQEFAVAAVVESGYSVGTIARLFRIQHWRLQKWVDEATATSRTERG